MTRSCKTCALYDLDATRSANGRVLSGRVAKCNWGADLKYPASLPPFKRVLSPYFMSPNDGANCECWTPRLVLMPRGHVGREVSKVFFDEAVTAPDAGQTSNEGE